MKKPVSVVLMGVKVMHNGQFIIHNGQFLIHNAQFIIHNVQFIIHNAQFIILDSSCHMMHYALKKITRYILHITLRSVSSSIAVGERDSLL